jgi:hypothetical protein
MNFPHLFLSAFYTILAMALPLVIARMVWGVKLKSSGGSGDAAEPTTASGVLRPWFHWMLLGFAVLWFIGSGPLRATMEWNLKKGETSFNSCWDFQAWYGSTRAWMQGGDPYDAANVQAVLNAAGNNNIRELVPVFNPPISFPLMAPFSLPNWPIAKSLWIYGMTSLWVAILLLLIRTADLVPLKPDGFWFAALAMILWPAGFCIFTGQPVLLVMFLIVLGVYFEIHRRDWASGAMFALAAVLKPQMAVFFLLYAALRFRLRWRIAASAACVGLLLATVGFGWMAMQHVDWMPSLQKNYQAGFAAGGANDPTLKNTTLATILTLQYPMRIIFPKEADIKTATFFSLTASLLLALAGLWPLRKNQDRRGSMLAYAIVAVCTLLAVYHRAYDGVLLLFPLLWAIMSWRTSNRRCALAVILLTTPFYFYSAFIILTSQLGKKYLGHLIPDAISNSWGWQVIVMPYQVYAVLLLAICLIYAAWRSKPEAEGA